MQAITRISITKRQPNRRRIYLDGCFAFACGINVVARFRLREGMSLSEDKLLEIAYGESRQKCMDRAMRFIETRLHSRVELQRKLQRANFSPQLIELVLAELGTLGYVDDMKFARVRADLAVQHRQHGRRRVKMDLLRRGVSREVVDRVIGESYESISDQATAQRLAEKHAPRLSRLEPAVARRRLAGLLARRGFDYEEVSSIVEKFFGAAERA